MAEQADVLEALRRGLISDDEARGLLGAPAGAEHGPPQVKPFGTQASDIGLEIVKKLASFGRGAAKFGAGIVGLPGDIYNVFSDIADPHGVGSSVRLPGSAESVAGLLKHGPEMYTPATPTEKGFEAAGSGLLSLANPTALAARAPQTGAGVAGIVSSLLGEAADQKTGGAPGAREAASLAALTPLLMRLRAPQLQKSIGPALTEVGQEGLTKAAVDQAAATRVLNVPTTLSHFLPQNSEIAAISREVAGSPQGSGIRALMEGESTAGKRVISDLVQSLSNLDPSQLTANRILAAGTKAVERPGEKVTYMVKKPYAAAGQDSISPAEADNLGNAIRGIQDRINAGRTSQAGRAIGRAATAVENAPNKYSIINPATNQPFRADLPVLEADTLRKEAAAKAAAADKLNATAVDKNTKLAQGTVAGEIAQATQTASPSLARGKALYARGQEAMVKPVEASALTSMFPDSMLKAGKGNWDVFSTVLDNPTKYGPTDIAYIGKHLRTADPTALPAVVKQNLLTKAEAATSPGAFADSLIGPADAVGGNTKANFAETIKQVALSHGKTPAEAAKASEGAVKAMEVLQQVQTGQGNMMGGVTSEFSRKAGANPASQFGQLINPMSWYFRSWAAGNVFERVIAKRTREQLAEALTSPQGIKTLMEMAEYNPTQNAVKILTRLGTAEHLQDAAAVPE